MTEKEMLLHLIESLEAAKSSLKASEKWAEKLGKKLGVSTSKIEALAQEALSGSSISDNGKVVEGLFDGQNMLDGEGNIFPVPANYASKSKLVEGDKLKLTVTENGSFIYKQIELVPRVLMVGHLIIEGSQYQVLVDKKVYNVLYASVTFYRANIGDQVTIIIPEEGNSKYAAIENVLPKIQESELAKSLEEMTV